MKITIPSPTVLSMVDRAVFKSEASLEHVHAVGLDVASVMASHMVIDASRLEKVIFIDAHLEKSNISDTLIRGCDLSAAHLAEAGLNRVHIDGGRMAGADMSRATIKDVVFEDCQLDMANFRYATLKNVHFKHCTLHETDLQAASLTDVSFESCELEKVEFGSSKIIRVDLRSSTLYNIHGWGSLKGAMIDSAQLSAIAPELAIELGLIIKD